MDSLPPLDERGLVLAVLARTPGAFERLVSEYQGLCWHILLRLAGNPEDARELCQEAFLRIHRNLHQYRHDSPLKSWIGRLAYHVGLRHLQRKRISLVDDAIEQVMQEIADDRENPERDYEERVSAIGIHRAIAQLPPLQRTLLTLYHLDELSIPEIAEITGLAIGTIKSHLFRSRLRLRMQLQHTEGKTP